MNDDVHKKMKMLKDATDIIGPGLQLAVSIGLEDFEEKARPFANGTLDAILPHFMSITDMRHSQVNLTHAIAVSQAIRELWRLLTVDAPMNKSAFNNLEKTEGTIQ